MSSLDNSSNDLHALSLPLKKSTRLVKQPTYLQYFHCNFVLRTNHVAHNHIAYPLSYVISYQHCTPSYQDFCFSISTNTEPKTYKQASQFDSWKQAMETRLLALNQNHTWSFVGLPLGKSIVGCRWIQKIKHKAYDTIERHKVRLVAKGYTHLEGVDYFETFSHVANLTIATVLLALAAINHWHL